MWWHTVLGTFLEARWYHANRPLRRFFPAPPRRGFNSSLVFHHGGGRGERRKKNGGSEMRRLSAIF